MGLIRDSAGNLYGTTGGGAYGAGVVFKVDKHGTETVLYSFMNSSDGGFPQSGLIRDTAGNLYGTTEYGGAGYGTVYELSPSGVETVLYTFQGPGSDGANPLGGVVRDTVGNFYGTTYEGGIHTGPGLVYELSLPGVETVLHNFTEGADDGGVPGAGVIRDAAGSLYGTTLFGGASNDGTVYKLTGGNVSILYSFCSVMNCTDGERPYSGLVRDGAGNFYGTTELGGAFGFGTVWKLAP